MNTLPVEILVESFLIISMLIFANGSGYVEEAIRVIKKTKIIDRFVGTTLWAYTSSIKSNGIEFFPCTPFELTGQMEWLAKNMP